MAAWISLPGVATELGHVVGKSKAVKMVLQCFLWVVFCSNTCKVSPAKHVTGRIMCSYTGVTEHL